MGRIDPEVLERERCCYFKKRWVGIPIPDEIPDDVEIGGDVIFGNHVVVDTNAFAKRDQVRGSEQPGAITVRAQDRLNHRADRSFSVRAGNMNNPACAF